MDRRDLIAGTVAVAAATALPTPAKAVIGDEDMSFHLIRRTVGKLSPGSVFMRAGDRDGWYLYDATMDLDEMMLCFRFESLSEVERWRNRKPETNRGVSAKFLHADHEVFEFRRGTYTSPSGS